MLGEASVDHPGLAAESSYAGRGPGKRNLSHMAGQGTPDHNFTRIESKCKQYAVI